MAIASMVQGIRTQIFNAIETAGPSVFYIVRYFSQTPVNPDRLPYEVRIRPIVAGTDAEAVARVPQIAYAGMWVQLFQRMEYQGDATRRRSRSSAPTITTWTSRAARCSAAGSSPAAS